MSTNSDFREASERLELSVSTVATIAEGCPLELAWALLWTLQFDDDRYGEIIDRQLDRLTVNGGRKCQRLGGGLRRTVRSGVLDRTRESVTDTWSRRTSTTVIDGEEHRCSRTWRNGLRFVGGC